MHLQLPTDPSCIDKLVLSAHLYRIEFAVAFKSVKFGFLKPVVAPSTWLCPLHLRGFMQLV